MPAEISNNLIYVYLPSDLISVDLIINDLGML